MLQQGRPTPQIQQWYDKLAPVVAEARATLRGIRPGKLVLRSGCQRDAEGDYGLTFLWQDYVVTAGDFQVRRAGTDQPASSFTSSLILTYLVTADGTTPSGRWIGFRELPDGMFYVQAFEAYSGGRLVRQLAGGVEAFRRAAESLGGTPLAIGEAGFTFPVLPRISLGLVYWQGDDEFPSQVRVLFEDSAAHYMPTDGLAILGSQLVGRLLKAAQ